MDAGSCNGCEVEITALNNPVYDVERLGIHFVASPRHADMLLVTGPVTRNMELALMKTYRATPEPKVVVAVGACGISGGIFGRNYATVGGVDRVVPVDVHIPGCPPRPHRTVQGFCWRWERSQDEMSQELRRFKAEIFQALAHPTRIAIVEALRDGETSAGQLIERLGLEQAKRRSIWGCCAASRCEGPARKATRFSIRCAIRC